MAREVTYEHKSQGLHLTVIRGKMLGDDREWAIAENDEGFESLFESEDDAMGYVNDRIEEQRCSRAA